MRCSGFAFLVIAGAALAASPAAPDFAGEYVTNLGLLVLAQDGDRVTGTFGDDGRYQIEGAIRDGKLEVAWRDGKRSGRARLELAEDGRLSGTWIPGKDEPSRTWCGWRRDPRAELARLGRFAGVWRSTRGILTLNQKGDRIVGRCGPPSGNVVHGTVRGRRLELTWERDGSTGSAWLEQTADGRCLFGVGRDDERQPRWRWMAHRLDDVSRKLRPRPGTLVAGIDPDGSTYCVRLPPDRRAPRRDTAIVLLHDAGACAKTYVEQFVRRWPTLAARYVLIGIDGECWEPIPGPSPQLGYAYENWTGRSTLPSQGEARRASPDLIADLLVRLRQRLRLERVLIGGHAQGGELALLLAMNRPEAVDGTFALAARLPAAADPAAFAGDDRKRLREAQRRTPIALLHGGRDDTVPASTSESAHRRLDLHGFPALMLSVDPRADHSFTSLPVSAAIRWLDSLTTGDARELLAFAEQSLAAKRWRDLSAALIHAEQVRLGSKISRQVDELRAILDEAVAHEADAWKKRIGKNADDSWVDPFHAWRVEFAFAPAAKPALLAYEKLRAQQEPEAQKLLAEAREARARGDEKAAAALLAEIAKRLYASWAYLEARAAD
jgi:predicted esterase